MNDVFFMLLPFKLQILLLFCRDNLFRNAVLSNSDCFADDSAFNIGDSRHDNPFLNEKWNFTTNLLAFICIYLLVNVHNETKNVDVI